MNSTLKWKLVAGFLLVFIAGGVMGALLSVMVARQVVLGHAHREIVAQRMREHLQHELRLTPQQLSKISPIIDRSAARLEGIRMATTQEVRQTFSQTHHEIAEDLTDEQRARFEQMNRRRQHWMQSHGALSATPSASDPTAVRE